VRLRPLTHVGHIDVQECRDEWLLVAKRDCLFDLRCYAALAVDVGLAPGRLVMVSGTRGTQSFAAVLRRYRIVAGLSQEALAERAGLSVRGISDLERGLSRTPRLHTLARLADALGLEPAARRALMVSGGYPAADDELPEPEPIAGSATRVAIQHVLRGYLTALLGRDGETRTVLDMLRRPDVRLFTLTGPGGVGKTRLAVQVASEARDLFPDGIAFVPLAPLRDADLVPTAIAHVLGVSETVGMPVNESLALVLRQQRMLLVLDNCEHVLDSAPLIAELLVRCPGLKILATSRTVLRVSGEHSFQLGPFAVADLSEASTPDAAAESPAVSCSCSVHGPCSRPSVSGQTTCKTCLPSAAASMGCHWHWNWRRRA
jgi:transcriptional regulator with XRE-family HTH domain